MESAKLQKQLAEQSAALEHANQVLADVQDLHAKSAAVRACICIPSCACRECCLTCIFSLGNMQRHIPLCSCVVCSMWSKDCSAVQDAQKKSALLQKQLDQKVTDLRSVNHDMADLQKARATIPLPVQTVLCVNIPLAFSFA